jgi:restriction system protein
MAKKQSKTTNCPQVRFFYEPTLRALNELGGSGSNEEIYNKVVAITNLTNDVLDAMHNFTMTEVEYRLAWARTYLKNYGAIENSRLRVWSLTAKGAKMLRDGNIDVKEIYNFTAKKQNRTVVASDDDVAEIEPVNWREQITNILLNLDPYAFERLAQRLLRECGFSDVQVTRRSGDGGIDGAGKLRIQGIFSFNVAFQCKRYKGQVGASEIRDFRGSLDNNIEKGVLITTGSFSKAAREEASAPGKKQIDIMDGNAFMDKLAEYSVGLTPRIEYDIDESFFSSIDLAEK